MNLIQRLTEVCPTWRTTVASDPLDAAVELGLIEAEDLDENVQELRFDD